MFKMIKHWWNKEVDNIFLISFGFMYHQVWIKFHILSFGFDFLFNIPRIFPIKESDKWLFFKTTDYKKLRSCHNLNLYNTGYTGLSLYINRYSFMFDIKLLGLWYSYELETIEKHYLD